MSSILYASMLVTVVALIVMMLRGAR